MLWKIAGILSLTLGLCLSPIQARADAHQSAVSAVSEGDFDRLSPAAATSGTTIDYTAWDDALEWFVLPMGVSLRQVAPKREPIIGTRFVYGHDSMYRMEGNRIAFSQLEDKQRSALTEYRRELEQVGSTVGLTSLSRNEQLAFWINLHNVAIIEQIALAYPVSSPRKVKIGGVALDEAKFITVSGISMSPSDIRQRIVYRNWRDPSTIYGFFRGDIGGPSIQRRAYTAVNVDSLLTISANEFVNALRGVSNNGNTLKVSTIYDEARRFYFPDWPHDVRAHLAKHAEQDVAKLLARTNALEASIHETDVADLSKGENEPLSTDESENCYFDGGYVCLYDDITVPLAIQRFVSERDVKIATLVREGRIGTVIISQEGEVLTPKEVE